MVSQPQDSEPKNVRRDDIYFMVTHRPGQNIKNEVMTIIGYPFKKGSDAVAEIGANKFDMFTSGDGAWVEKPATETNIVGAMKCGAKMVIKGTSWRGTRRWISIRCPGSRPRSTRSPTPANNLHRLPGRLTRLRV